MATLLIATPFVHSDALRNNASGSDARGHPAQKRLRVSCRQASASASGERHRVGASDDGSIHDEVSVLQSSSAQNASLANWIATSFEMEDVHTLAPQSVPAPKFQLLEPVVEFEGTKPHHGERRRSERTVIFTEEKARRLREANRATQTFHDEWYHSAIASRLANPE